MAKQKAQASYREKGKALEKKALASDASAVNMDSYSAGMYL